MINLFDMEFFIGIGVGMLISGSVIALYSTEQEIDKRLRI